MLTNTLNSSTVLQQIMPLWREAGWNNEFKIMREWSLESERAVGRL